MRRWMVSIVLAVLAVGIVVATSKSEQALNLGADVVIGNDGRTVFYRDEEGRAHARNVRDGRLKWSTGLPARPISLLGDQLLVQVQSPAAGEAQLRWLDAGSGAPGKAATLKLPNEVTAHLDPQLSAQFDWIPETAAGEVLLHWRYSAQPARGALMLDAEVENVTRAGVSALKLGATTATARAATAEPIGIVYALTPSERLAGLGERQFRSIDGQHVLVSESEPDPNFASRYRWRIFSASGNQLGEYLSLQAFTPFLVTDNVLLLRASPHIERLPDGRVEGAPERLLAVDLKTSSVGWSATVMDSVYRGMVPP